MGIHICHQFLYFCFAAYKRKLLGGDESRACESSESVLHGANPVLLYWKLPYVYPHRGQIMRTFFERFIINGTKQSGQHLCHELLCIRLSEKFLSFYKEIVDAAQHFSFYIILSNYVWSILFYQNKDHNVRQIRFHVCIKMHRCKRKTLFEQPNNTWSKIIFKIR